MPGSAARAGRDSAAGEHDPGVAEQATKVTQKRDLEKVLVPGAL